MRRRTVLGVTGALFTPFLAGCGGNQYSDWLWIRPANSEQIVKLRTRTVDNPVRSRFVREIIRRDGLNSTDPIWYAVEKPDYYYFLDEPTYVNGTVYDFTEQKTGSVEFDVYIFTLEAQNTTSEADAEAVVDYSDLPPVDRRAFRPLFYIESRKTTTETDPPGAQFDGSGFRARYRTAATNRSRLLNSNVTAVRINGTRYEIRKSTAELNETVDSVQYSITDRWSVEAYADRIRKRFRFTLDGLSKAERKVVETAISQNKYEITDADEAARSLLDTLENHEQIAESSTLPNATPPYRVYEPRLWLAGYDGDEYLIQYVEKTFD